MSATQDWTRKQITGDPVTKLVLRTIGDFANWETGSCYPSIERLSECCEAHPNTVRRHLRILEENGFITLQKRNGTSYLITLVGYSDWYKTLPARKIKGGTSTVGVQVGEGYTSGSGGLPEEEEGATRTVAKHSNLNILNNSYKKNDNRITDCNAEEETRVYFHNEQIKLCDELNQLWLKQFDGQQDDLNLALIQIAAYVQPNNRTRSLEAQVSSQLARIVRDRKEKDKRYAAAAKNKSTNAKPSSEPFGRKPSYDQNAHKFWEKVDKGEIKL